MSLGGRFTLRSVGQANLAPPRQALLREERESGPCGGYDFKFVNEVSEEFLCPICLLVLKEPHLSGCCGHHFCQTCITRVKDDRGPCPLCKQRYFSTLMDKSVQRKVNDLRVFCRSKGKGCRWEGELSSYESHIQLCKYVKVDCDYGCGVKVFRTYLEAHKNWCVKRPVSCEHCGHKATWKEVVSEHTKVCAKYPVPCPNSCGDKIARMDVDPHLIDSCPLTVVPCKFEFAGCPESACRKYMHAHFEASVASHLSLLADTCLKLKKDSEAKDKKIYSTTGKTDPFSDCDYICNYYKQ